MEGSSASEESEKADVPLVQPETESKPSEASRPPASVATDDSSSPNELDHSPAQPPLTLQPVPFVSHQLPPPAAEAGPSSVPSPGPRRPKPPTKGILKPPPPPAKPTLGNRLRDLASTVVGGSKLFEGEEQGSSRGPTAGSTGSTSPPSAVSATVGGTLNALSGRLGLGLSRFVAGSTSPSGSSTPNGSPLPAKVALPDVGGAHPGTFGAAGMSEKSRQKQPLKRATFVLPSLSIIYPISSQGEPWSIKVIEDRRRIETTHRTIMSSSTGAEYWTSQRLVALYESACRGREERPRVGVVRALEVIASPPRPRHIHLILRPFDPNSPPSSQPQPAPNTLDVPLNRHAAEALADVLSSEWGLAELKLEGGSVETEDALKPILHALLISGTLPSLSLEGNRRIKAGGWRLLAVFLKRARVLRYINLSDTTWDKRGVEYLVQALTCAQVRGAPSPQQPSIPSGQMDSPNHSARLPNDPPRGANGEEKADEENGIEEKEDSYGSFIPPAPLLKEHDEASLPAAIQTLKMEGCGLKATVLETLAQGVRSSDIKNISLRRNRIGPLGAVALALMIRDYPDSAMSLSSLSPSLISATSTQTTSNTSPDASASNAYTAYVPRTRRPNSSPIVIAADDANLPPIPLVVSSTGGGITSRTLPEGYKLPLPPKNQLVMPPGGASAMHDGGVFAAGVNSVHAEGKTFAPEGGASMALQRNVRALDGVERIGRLLTLDLKNNEIRSGIGYIAQVLKRNRTLKVLNLSDNKIEPPGLAALAEALKYNSSLETLDMSSNPCASPGLEGITALRTTFTVNTSLKRLFLSDTGLTSEGAIALAEFLPETKSLLHLDLTSNPLDTAGILAISVGLKSNTLIRCLDLSIPPNDPDLAELSQLILQSCVRNTELAASVLSSKAASQEAIWAPIKKSELVKQVKVAELARAEQERVDLAQSPEGLAREYAYTLKPKSVPAVCGQVAWDLQRWMDAGAVARKPGFHAWEPGQLPKEEYFVLLERAKALRERLVEQVQETNEDAEMASLLSINDTLATLIDRSKGFAPPPRLLLPSQIVPLETQRRAPAHPPSGLASRYTSRRHLRNASLEISSPNFSIGDSDGDSDAEELDVGRFSGARLPDAPKIPTASASRGVSNGKKAQQEHSLIETGETETDIQREVREAMEGVDEKEEGEERLGDDPALSPVEKVSRAWVEEEAEIFRKGTRLGVADEEEVEEHQDVSGEELRQEILETEVARSPTRRVILMEEEEGKVLGDQI